MIHGIILTDTLSDFSMRPLGAYTIANILRNNGYNVIVIDMYTKMSMGELRQLLDKFITKDTIFLGYSSTLFVKWDLEDNDYTWLLTPVNHFKEINQYAKNLNPNLKIMFGGSASYQFINYVAKNNDNCGVNIVMHGYSESMIVDSVNALSNKKTVKFSKKTSGIYEVDYDFKGTLHPFNSSSYSWHNHDLITDNESLPIEISRGCIFKCKFCSFPLLGKSKNDNSYMKQEDILLNEILDNYNKYKTLNYFIIDDTFNERIDKIEMMLRIRDRSKLNLSFSGYNRVDLIHRFPQQMQLLYDLNFKGMLFGIESLNYESAKSIGKGLKPELQIETLYKIKEHYNNNVSITGSFIIGLPHETPETFTKWADWAVSEESPLDVVVFAPLIIGQIKNTHSESEFFKDYGKYGYELSVDKKQWYNKYWSFKDCGKLMFKYMDLVEKTGKQKIPPMTALSLTKLGYNFDELIKMPLKTIINSDVNVNRLGKRIDLNEDLISKFNQYKNTYINQLLNL